MSIIQIFAVKGVVPMVGEHGLEAVSPRSRRSGVIATSCGSAGHVAAATARHRHKKAGLLAAESFFRLAHGISESGRYSIGSNQLKDFCGESRAIRELSRNRK